MCAARVSRAASGVAVKRPAQSDPRACAARWPACAPDKSLIASTTCSARSSGTASDTTRPRYASRQSHGILRRATATVDPHVHLLPAERTAGLMRWLHRGLPGVAIPIDITWERALADLRAAGAERVVNLLFPLRAGEAEELHRFGAALSAREPDVVPVGGVHKDDPDPEACRARRDRGPRHARA